MFDFRRWEELLQCENTPATHFILGNRQTTK